MATGSKLARNMSFFALFVYGVGDILGAGIYALVGPVARVAGSFLWLSFALALLVAGLTALSYAEMCSRFPKSGGAAHFVSVTFQKPIFSFITGWLLLFVSVVSMATLTRAFDGYLNALGVNLPATATILLFLATLGLINLKGIRESSQFNIVATTIEALGLVTVVIAGGYFLIGNDAAQESNVPFSWSGLFKGASLAFYAFIGFEDLANVAEEVKEPERNLPRAIVSSLATAGLLYLLIGYTSVEVAGANKLGSSDAPLTEVIIASGLPIPLQIFSVIALFAVANTCLLNSVTGSRLLFGLADDKLVPDFFQNVNAKFQTPHYSIAFVFIIAALMAFLGTLESLAGATSALILSVFAATNYSLIKVQTDHRPHNGFKVPIAIPILALIANFALLVSSDRTSIAIAAGIGMAGFALYWLLFLLTRPN